MAALAIQSLPADSAIELQLPELSESDYLSQVLHQPEKGNEAALDDELAKRATALGISSRPSSSAHPDRSGAQSALTFDTCHARTDSTGSNGSRSTALTVHSSTADIASAEITAQFGARKRSKSLNFAQYDKFLAQLDPSIRQPKIASSPTAEFPDQNSSPVGVGTKKGFWNLKNGIKTKIRWRKKHAGSSELLLSCICCRDEFNIAQGMYNLPCGHTYCASCLIIMANQATADESKFPPRCCTQPIPSSVIKAILPREEQQAFLKSALLFSTPWEARIFCPRAGCGEFIAPGVKIDPKYPFDVVCRVCKSRVCTLCKRAAHEIGQDCPEDWELDAVLKLGEKSGWRRCYKCRNLVELTHGCTHMTCRCRAQFCYICGAVWLPPLGCPNLCNGDEELERRRMEEEARLAALEEEKAAQEADAARLVAEQLDADKRTEQSAKFQALRNEQIDELQRFQSYERKSKWLMWTRHSERKSVLFVKYSDQIEKMKERHAKTAQHLEDRQIAAEMELRSTLEMTERSVKIRLKHMEAYCDGLGRTPEGGMPSRVVTERDLRELGQQYNVRDGMDRLHQAKINVMRDRQAKKMEELLERQEVEMDKLERKRDEEIDHVGAEFAQEEDVLLRVFEERRAKLQRRWELAIEILQKELEKEDGVRYGLMDIPDWPTESTDETLAETDELVDDGDERTIQLTPAISQ